MRIYNTLSGQKEEFLPQGPGVKLYVCGITPYAPCHVGHAMSYVVFDTLRRYLEFKGYSVRHVQNFTDIDDKIIQQSQLEGISYQDLAQRYIQEYFENMEALNVQRAQAYPKATEEIPEMIEIIRSLLDKGYAYIAGNDVYFRVKKVPDYGKLSHRNLEGMAAGARVEVDARKEHPMDFVLWKGAKPGEPWWDSPWGPGRPGWHIECTAIALKYLGETLDFHGGGQDLIFPHHENERVQSEVYTGAPFVRFWVHNGLLQVGSDKMSKSLGNLIPVKVALQRYGPDALRLYFLSSHYRSPLVYSEEGLVAAGRALDRLHHALKLGSGDSAEALDPEPFRRRFISAMDEDFNTPQALAALFDLAREINRYREEGKDVRQAQEVLRQLAGVLGLTLTQATPDLPARPLVELLVEVRNELRAAKQWALADQIRSRLSELDIILEDTPQGTQWKYTRAGGPGPTT